MYSDVVQRFMALCFNCWKSATSDARWGPKRCRYIWNFTVL